MEYTATEQSEQRNVLLNALKENHLTDTTFIIGSNHDEFRVNRTFLALMSPVFKVMLFGGMQESQSNCEIIIADIKPSVFESVLQFAYCNDPRITSTNVVSLHRIADKYQIEALLKWCQRYVRSCLNETNICILLNEAIVSHQTAIVQCCKQFYENNFVYNDIVGSIRFKDICANAMRELLQWKRSMVEEELLWEHLIKWSDYQSAQHADIDTEELKYEDINHSTNNSALLQSVTHLVKFDMMQRKYFISNVVPHNILSKDQIIQVLSGNMNSDTYNMLCYSLDLSSKHKDACNTYDTLINDDLFQCAATWKAPGFASFIHCDFESVVHIKRIEIAPPKISTGEHIERVVCEYGKKQLWNTELNAWQYDENDIHGGGAYHTIHIPQCRDYKIRSIDVDITTSTLTFTKTIRNRVLGVGHLRIYGLPK